MEKVKNYIIVGLLVLVGTSFAYAMKSDKTVTTKPVSTPTPVVEEQKSTPIPITEAPSPQPAPSPEPIVKPQPIKTIAPKPVITTPEPIKTRTCSEAKKAIVKSQEYDRYQSLVNSEETRFNFAMSKLGTGNCGGAGIYQSVCGDIENDITAEKHRYGQTLLKLAQDHKSNMEKIESTCY